jgi:hypothetical protein
VTERVEEVDDELARLGAIVVEERVLRRLIKAHRRIRSVGLQVPHEHCYAIARAELEPLIERGDVGVELARLPDRLILVRGDRDELDVGTPDVMTDIWRAVFHARVHLSFDTMLATKQLTVAAIKERINRIGQTEFDEIRSVLKQEDLLLPPVDDTATYIEFVALYLELAFFAPLTVERTFPAVFDTRQVDATIALDLDARALLEATRPARAPAEPLIPEAEPEPYADAARLDYSDPAARKPAAAARRRGNRSRAAILSARSGDLSAAREDLDALVERLSLAIGNVPPNTVDALLPVAHFAASQRLLRFDAGARLLYDLQAACIVAEREDKVVDVFGWALSRGKRSVVRALPSTREVRIAKHLHAASRKSATCGLPSPEQREPLADVLHAMARRADDNLRVVLRPKIERALDDVELHPFSLPERVAEKKLVDEMLDRAVAVGRLSLPDLRDVISRNDLKMPDLTLHEIKTGDQLLRCDRILSTSIDGVYRRGESYLRFLQRISSLLFGTAIGRVFTLYLMLPFLGSFAVVEGLQHMVGPLVKMLTGTTPTIATNTSLLAGAGFLFLLLHVKLFRRAMILLARGLLRALRFVLWDVPIAIWRSRPVQWLLGSWFNRFLLKPAIPGLVAAAIIQNQWRWPIAGGVYVAFAIALNIRLGRLFEELVTDWLVRSSRQITGKIIPGAIRYILAVFNKAMELVDRGLYRVDEWLRFRSGQGVVKLVIRGIVGTIWFIVTYVLRLYINLFVEPTVNPIKHFPVVTVAAKLIIPFIPSILSGVAGPASSLMGPALGNGFAAFTVLVLPGLAGFLVWELKENWKLYRATRAKTLRPLGIGHHGETMASFLKPGFHSGTIPKLFTKLRRAAWKSDERGVAKQREGLHHAEEAIERFADRQLVSMLNEVAAFRATDVALHHVEIGSNRIQISLVCPSVGDHPAVIRFEQQSGWLVASLSAPGWIDDLRDDQRLIAEIALAGFYKLSGTDIIREQIEHALRGAARTAPPYDISDEGLVVWPGPGYETEIVYDLHTSRLKPTVRGAKPEAGTLDLRSRHAMFGREQIYWSIWSTTWQQIAKGEPPSIKIVAGPSLIRERA